MDNKYLKYISNLLAYHPWKIIVGIIIATLLLGYRANSLQLQMSFDKLLKDDNQQIHTFNEIIDSFDNASNILLIAEGHEDSLRSFAYGIKPLLESFDEWISGVHIHIENEFLTSEEREMESVRGKC